MDQSHTLFHSNLRKDLLDYLSGSNLLAQSRFRPNISQRMEAPLAKVDHLAPINLYLGS